MLFVIHSTRTVTGRQLTPPSTLTLHITSLPGLGRWRKHLSVMVTVNSQLRTICHGRTLLWVEQCPP